MEHSKVFIDKLKDLKEMGITILLDDFGSGYSSLKYLDNLPIDVLKIDKSFIDGLNDDGDRKQLVEVILTLARQIHVSAVAEGVETEKQLARLAAYQCEVVQGYLFSKPVPEEMVRSLLGDANQYRLKGDEEIDDNAFRLPI
jgi:EAL domain-containing protein (putative c-di-GMP-specific phosphodiesterase class I)